MKPLLDPADIHVDDDGTGLVEIHTDLGSIKDSWYLSIFQTRILPSNSLAGSTLVSLTRII